MLNMALGLLNLGVSSSGLGFNVNCAVALIGPKTINEMESVILRFVTYEFLVIIH